MKAVTLCLNPTLQKTLVFSHLQQGEVNRTHQYFTDPSGKGINVSRVLTQLGIENIHITHSGGQFKTLFHQLCLKESIPVAAADSPSEIRWCTTIVDDNHTTELVEEAFPVPESMEGKIRYLLGEHLNPEDYLIISGSKAPGYGEDFFARLLKETSHKKTIIDYRGKDLLKSLPQRPWIIKPNEAEFISTFFPDTSPTSEEIKEKMRELRESFGCHVILTRGNRPTLYTLDHQVKEAPRPPKVIARNTTGCGDTFTAALTAALMGGKSLEEGVIYAQEIAAQGATTLRPAQLK